MKKIENFVEIPLIAFKRDKFPPKLIKLSLILGDMSTPYRITYIINWDGGKSMICKRLRDLREDQDLRQEDVAAALGIPTRTYGNYEMGVRNVPLDVLMEIAQYYGVSTDYLLGLTDVKKPYPKKLK